MFLSLSINSELHSSKSTRNASSKASRVKPAPFGELLRPTLLPAKTWLSLAQRVEMESFIFCKKYWKHQKSNFRSEIDLNSCKINTLPLPNWNLRQPFACLTRASELTADSPQSKLWLVGSPRLRKTVKSDWLTVWRERASNCNFFFYNVLFTSSLVYMCISVRLKRGGLILYKYRYSFSPQVLCLASRDFFSLVLPVSRIKGRRGHRQQHASRESFIKSSQVLS